MHKILQKHLLCAFVAKLKIVAIYALYPVFATKILLSGKLVSMAWFSVTTGLKFFVLINAINFDEKHPQMKKKLH